MKSRDTNKLSNEQEQPPSPKTIVCIYAQRDEPFYHELQTHFVVWQGKGHIRWLDLSPGVDVEQTLQAFIHHSDLILLLISPSFFATSVCYKAMISALAEQTRRDIPVVPVLLRASDWKESDCGGLKALPENELPIAEWEHKERAYENIRSSLSRLIPGLSTHTTALPGRPYLFQARDLPKGYVPRPKVFHDIKSKLLNRGSNQPAAITTALRGTGGFGKTTLASALCHDPEIQAAFPDGILWVELGEQPPRALDLLNGLLTFLEISPREAITMEEAQERWIAALDGRTCLLVIDDVWQATALEPLLMGGPQCMRLVTTRNDLVLPEETARVCVDAMELEEAMEVLSQGLPEIQQVVYQPRLVELVTRLGCWPLLLTLAHGMLATLVEYGQGLTDALTLIEHAYETYGVTAFQLNNRNQRQKTVNACLEASLHHLGEFSRPHYHAVERYQELAVFPEDTDIPLATLQIFWKGTAQLEPWETTDLCISLHQLSLLLTCDLGKGIVRLHDVMLSYLEQRAKPHVSALHVSLLNAYWQVLDLQRWADLPPGDFYMWQHLVQHLYRIGDKETLQATLTDLWYIIRKALYVGVLALEEDLLLASTLHIMAAEPAPIFPLLHRNMMRLSHLLRQVQTSAEMGGLLLSHLGWDSTFAAQRLVLERELPRPFLIASHPLPDGSSSALRRTFYGHIHRINGCTVSPDGYWIVSASEDGTLKVWDAATGVERLTLSGHSSAVKGCAVSPDGGWIVSASEDSTLKVWDVATGAERLTLSGHTKGVMSCTVSPDGRWIVSASEDSTLKVWDAATGVERLTLTGHTKGVMGCAVSPDGGWIVSASDDCTLKVWDAATGAERLTLSGQIGAVNDCAVSPDRRWIVSASNDGTLKVWDAATGAEQLTLSGHTDAVWGCAVSPDGGWIVSASDDGTLKVWDAATGAERLTLSGHSSWVRHCVVSPDGDWIVSASDDCTLKMWNTTTEAEQLMLSGQIGAVNGCAVSPDGYWIVSASNDGTLKVWDAATGAARFTLAGHNGAVRRCAVSLDGGWIVSASEDGTLKVWDAATGAERLTLSGQIGAVNDCAVSPDRRWIVSASEDGTLKVWDAATGVERLTLSGHSSAVKGCAVSPDGGWIVSASDDGTLKVWDAATGAERLTLSGHTKGVWGCEMSPDGRWIISVSADQTLKIWDAATGAERMTLFGHSRGIWECAVSPDGRWIISASADQTLKVWEVQTGRCVFTFPVDGRLRGCKFHSDGEHLVTCGLQGMYFLRLVV